MWAADSRIWLSYSGIGIQVDDICIWVGMIELRLVIIQFGLVMSGLWKVKLAFEWVPIELA